ncbi:MAG: hypothetical protein GW795_13630 [Cyanobacteria bacterium]|jgi:hypothetical protein|nr:hypothetical protein [Cyanobacteria bacterium CG_2015-16_32_12]NCO78025.1 hypothetical protein [Cyanobacteria bacterium CG_2015-22_32_23]NCQ05183.1 hypothetical protein [Cyanobacteria bacterium CG_2015-09_32_10]NCQ42880.1 hypothetical protein [Cyanobacteria bacterium CG_2015-04_32_10]NCS85157.1 hypothetical protein [Cyanobacteria bacterium CG_2015-02_32_10]
MNASEKAKGLEITSKIASIVNLFKEYFPDAKGDLKPWHNDPDTINLVDPDSIDIGFHFPGWSHKIQARSILIQIRFHSLDEEYRLIGMETAGFNHGGEVWRLSTIDNWQIEGKSLPYEEIKDKLKLFSRDVFQLFYD